MPIDSHKSGSGRQRPGKPDHSSDASAAPKKPKPWALRLLGWLLALLATAVVAGIAVVVVVVATIYPKLPDVSDLADYRPKLPLRVFSAEGALIGEFGEERRKLMPIEDIPPVMKQAILAAEDARFFEHNGIDYRGIARAALANVRDLRSQGASTISMQVARNMYLSPERTFTRKVYEILLTLKLEHMLSKDEILEIYMNQIFLGNRAYGFSAAAETYFGKPLESITTAEAAMLAGLPVAPSQYNPIRRPERARIRQLHIINRMQENGFITAEQAQQARDEKLTIRRSIDNFPVRAEYVAEMVRQAMVERYGQEAYTRGLNVYTTIEMSDQEAAYQALRAGIMDYEKRQFYRGPENFVNWPADPEAQEEVLDKALAAHPDNGELLSAVVVEASRQKVIVTRTDGERLEITGDGLKPVQSGLADKAAANIKIRPGAIVRIMKAEGGQWVLTQLPEVEGAFVAMDPRSGAIQALVGGFDFNKNKFNHVTQAWRQAGSSFKPFIYSAALERGFTPATVIADSPMYFSAAVTGSRPWEPRNYDGRFDGAMSMRTALAKSKNIISVRLLQAVGPKQGREWALRFGFSPNKLVPVLPMALGSGEVTPLQMAAAYSVFANGGHRIEPWLIERVTDYRGKVLSQIEIPKLEELPQVIDPRNAFVMSSMMQDVMRIGTGARARNTLKRPDIYGKTGTTNDALDAWFAGYQPTLTAVAWVGYDNPRNLGSRETGGGLSLPIWTRFMQHALKDVPVTEIEAPTGVVRSGNDWAYREYADGRGIASLGLETLYGDASTGGFTAPSAEERAQIMDLFRN
ncbi:penicillin-binding protein 1A [Corticibacter populi]|uniref:Penicillin-binding protein 1A n=1 Tax=Corticibacter populi TaxID=1550736 RepID=A0A3M6QUH2_9BURK|nr:penicillin-binding protein 1A [Corticibacter populi]RMX06677.1 penicillin-binding protein 1A [Corticibacter populi]RZS31746.1 penicillin-binding protein 1A [Corticibacter populi]